MTGGNKSTIAAIDLTRFLCALMVLAHHYAAMFALRPDTFLHLAGPDVTLASDWAWWSWPGWVGVELFFVISGYVIAMSAANSRPRAFLKRRLLRLAPVAWICSSLTAVVLATTAVWPIDEVAVRWLTSLLFWPSRPQIDGSYWSLGLEVNFYLLIALQLGWRGGGGRAVERTGMALAIVGAVYWLLRIDGLLPPSDRTVDLLLLPYGGFFATGIALSGLHASGWTTLRGSMLLLGLASSTAEILSQSEFFTNGLGLSPQPWLPLSIFAVGVTAIGAAKWLQAPLTRVFGIRLIAFAGLMTYPLYLIHHYMGAVLIVALLRRGVEDHVAMVSAAAVMLVLAAVITGLAERPARRALDRLISRRVAGRDGAPGAPLPTR